jgi:hypothetical protein
MSTNKLSGYVALATAETDLGVFPTHSAWTTAREYANSNHVAVTVRDAVTDEAIDIINPEKEDRHEIARAFLRMRREA